MDAYVRQLRVSIAGVAERDRGDWFARRVLAQFCQILEDRYPGRDIAIRRVDLRCSLAVGQLTDAGEVLRCARELAASIDDGLVADDGVVPSTHPASAPLAERREWDSERSVEAAVVGDSGSVVLPTPRPGHDRRRVAADGKAGAPGRQDLDAASDSAAALDWLITCLRAGSLEAWLDPPGGHAEPATIPPAPERRRLMIAALSHLHARGQMLELLARMAPAALAILLTTLNLQPSARVPVHFRPAAKPARPDAATGGPGSAESDDAGAQGRDRPRIPDIPPSLSADAAAVAELILTQVQRETRGLSMRSPAKKTPGPGVDPPRTDARRSDSFLDDDSSPGTDRMPGRESSPGTDVACGTGFGGLFYLLALLLELGFGETLWKACLPEGQVLVRAVRCVLGEKAAGDGAVSLFGGVMRAQENSFPTVSATQREAVCEEMLTGWVAAFPRAGVSHLSVPMLDVAASRAGRILVASCGFPAAIFAWPAPDAASVTAGIETFLRHWPLDAEAPMASGVLPDFDPSGRLRRSPASRPAVPWMPACGKDANPASIMAQLCGSVLSLFHARLMAHGGADISDVAGLITRYLAVPGRIALSPGTMTILLPMDRIDIALRAAGLDRDPGWVPWLRRTVRIEFEPVGPDDVS